MTDNFDLDEFFRTPKGDRMKLEEFMQKLDQLTRLAEQTGLSQGIENRLKDWKARGLDRPAEGQPERFDVAAANAQINRLAEQYQRLSSAPDRNIARMDEIMREIAELEGKIAGQGRADRAAYLEGNRGELDQLGNDIETLNRQIQALYNDPGANWGKIQELQTQLDERSARWEQIQAGGETPLEWNGGDHAEDRS